MSAAPIEGSSARSPWSDAERAFLQEAVAKLTPTGFSKKSIELGKEVDVQVPMSVSSGVNTIRSILHRPGSKSQTWVKDLFIFTAEQVLGRTLVEHTRETAGNVVPITGRKVEEVQADAKIRQLEDQVEEWRDRCLQRDKRIKALLKDKERLEERIDSMNIDAAVVETGESRAVGILRMLVLDPEDKDAMLEAARLVVKADNNA